MSASAAVDLLVPGDPSTRTGGYVYDRRMLAALAARGWRVRVHALDASFPQPTEAAVGAAAATLAALPDGARVVVDGLALAGLAEVLAAEAARLRLVALVHHPLALETGLAVAVREALRRAETAALAAVRGVITTSGWTARALAPAGVDARRLRVVEPGIDPAAPGAAAAPRGAALPCADPGAPEGSPADRLASGELRLLCVATLTPRKGHALLLEALGRLTHMAWRLDCVGSTGRDPATAAAIARLVRSLGLEGRVRLRGELDERALARRYARADAFVLASYFEGYGMALAEAVAYGLPIVSTTGGAIPETVPPEAALLVPPGDAEALTGALRRLLAEPGLRARLAAAARSASARLPSWQAAGERFAAALESLAS